MLSKLAYGVTSEGEGSTLSDLYEVAKNAATNLLGKELRQAFTCDSSQLPSYYNDYFASPWFRCYTLNIDDLENASARRWTLPRRIQSLSALREGQDERFDALNVVHLNGMVNDFPNVTFGPQEFASRTAYPDSWMLRATAELITSPVVFIGTTLDEPSLWHFLQLRDGRQRGQRELRPGSYLVVPTLDRARRDRLKRFNIDHVPMTAEEFASDFLAPLTGARTAGLQALSIKVGIKDLRSQSLPSVGELVKLPATNAPDFLLGREPEWADFVGGYAIERNFDLHLNGSVERCSHRLVIITGTAGCGKSTSLMRLALRFSGQGVNVRWVHPELRISAGELMRAVRKTAAEYLFIDDLDALGEEALQTLLGLLEKHPALRIYASLRSSRTFSSLERLTGLNSKEVFWSEYTVPNLEDSDIDLLLDALTDAKRLGVLAKRDREEQRRLFKGEKRANRQLLVALREATLGENFDKRIESECRDLGLEYGLLYGMLAVATSQRHGLSRDELLIGSGRPGFGVAARLQHLQSRGLVVADSQEPLRVRHRAIADLAVQYLRKEGQLAEPLQALCLAMAHKVTSATPQGARTYRLLARTLSHDYMIKLTADREVPRQAYESVEPIIGSWSHQYWLQRGRFEMETGRLDNAQNFLEQAKALAPDDWFVEISYADLQLAKAIREDGTLEAQALARSGLQSLRQLVATKGKKSPYPYHVLGRRGLEWSQSGSSS